MLSVGVVLMCVRVSVFACSVLLLSCICLCPCFLLSSLVLFCLVFCFVSFRIAVIVVCVVFWCCFVVSSVFCFGCFLGVLEFVLFVPLFLCCSLFLLVLLFGCVFFLTFVSLCLFNVCVVCWCRFVLFSVFFSDCSWLCLSCVCLRPSFFFSSLFLVLFFVWFVLPLYRCICLLFVLYVGVALFCFGFSLLLVLGCF